MENQDDFGISKQDWEKTFDAITDFVSVLDKDFKIIRVNRALAEFLKQSPESLVGRNCYEVMHGRDSHWDGCPHEQMMRDKLAVTLEVDDPFIGTPLLVTASPIINNSGELIGSVHVAKDVSLVKKMRETLALRNQQLEVLNKLTNKAIKSQNLKDVVQVALEGVIKACSPDLALYYTIAGDWLTLQGAIPADEEHLNHKKKVGECLCGLAAAQGVPVFSEDIQCDVRCTLSECKEAGIRSFAALPIIHDNTTVGVLGVASKSETRYSDDQDFLLTLAATVGIVAHNALLIEEIRNESEMLEKKIIERTHELEKKNKELERFNTLFVNREFRIKELRDKVARLQKGAGHDL